VSLREIINRQSRKDLQKLKIKNKVYSDDPIVNRILRKLDGYKPKDNRLYGSKSRLTRERSLTEILGGIIKND
jgi:hypothetical protein